MSQDGIFALYIGSTHNVISDPALVKEYVPLESSLHDPWLTLLKRPGAEGISHRFPDDHMVCNVEGRPQATMQRLED